PFHEAAGPEFGSAIAARPMVYDDFPDAKSARSRHDRDKAVHFTVQADLAKHLSPVAFHAAVVVVEMDPGHEANQSVEHAAWPDLVPRIEAELLPPADDVESAFDLVNESRNLGWVVLKVGVECQNELALG